MVNWNLYAEAKWREQERIDEALNWRLMKAVAAGRPSSVMALRDRGLAWLGECLVATGTRLQMQFK